MCKKRKSENAVVNNDEEEGKRFLGDQFEDVSAGLKEQAL